MPRPSLEVADIFRIHGSDYREKRTLSPKQWQVMRAIEICRTVTLGGHVDRCDQCGHQHISYNSCRNRHCPKCQSLAKAKWLIERRRELLPVEYYHVVFTLPNLLASLALQNKQTIYDAFFRSTSETITKIASDTKYLGAKIGFLAILHTWGQSLLHHPHLHCIVPGGGISPDGQRWIPCRPGFFLPVRVLSRLFRTLFLEKLQKLYQKEKIQFLGVIHHLNDPTQFNKLLQSAKKTDWVVYAKPPFAGPEKVLDYLSRYTHRIAISNHRLLRLKNGTISFKYRDYKHGNRQRIMSLKADEFIRRFLMHVIPNGYVRIRYYGYMANCQRSSYLKKCGKLLETEITSKDQLTPKTDWAALLESLTGIDPFLCPKCQKGRLILIKSISPAPLLYPHRRAPPEAGPL